MRIALSIAGVLFACGLSLGCRPSAEQIERSEFIPFETAYDNLNREDNTDLHVEDFWKKVEGKKMKSSGKIVDVSKRRGYAQVTVANKSRPSIRGFNIVLSAPDTARAAELKREAYIDFQGTLKGFKATRESKVVILLDNVVIAE
jgi:hypothetical protein